MATVAGSLSAVLAASRAEAQHAIPGRRMRDERIAQLLKSLDLGPPQHITGNGTASDDALYCAAAHADAAMPAAMHRHHSPTATCGR